MDLNTKIETLTKVGKTTAKKLERLGIFTVYDLLNYYPFRYEDFSRIEPIGNLHEGEVVTVKGAIELIANRRIRNRRSITEAILTDASGSIRLVWFNQPYLADSLPSGTEVYISGTVKRDKIGLQFVSPAYELSRGRNIHTGRLVPMYPLTEGITQKQIRFLVEQSLPATAELSDWLPEEIRKQNNLQDFAEAVRQIHFPESNEKLAIATERLKFDELFLIQMRAELSRFERTVVKAPPLAFHEEEIKKFVAGLPFALTKDQKVAAWEILQNIAGTMPMNRLLSGDVGSGKTVVAAIALYNTALSGFQGALMAPTEILAKQHFDSICKLLPDKRVVLFTRSQKFKKELKKIIASGEADIIIGTHALLSEGVEFKKIGLVVVDEQHRFGVLQRKVIRGKGRQTPPNLPLDASHKGRQTHSNSPLERGRSQGGVHFLSMTATPIPRSLALMLYGDLDVSIIREMPPGRKPVMTRIVESHNREKAYDFIKKEIEKGGQVFVVCPLIDGGTSPYPLLEGEGVSDKKSVMSEYKKLSEQIFPKLRVNYLHGRMKADEKEKVMSAFKNKEFDILVATSVIEVGVDVP
ncbi:MAG: ATP-dependent DNA helicase RecG, partial [Patescibacteria group bacterium]